MPKFSYGPAAKGRVAYLLTVLLDYANDELEVVDDKAEDELERLRSHLTVHWEGDRHLIVRTKLRYLAQLSTLAPGEMELTTAQIKDGFKYLEQFLGILEDNRASRRGSDTWHFTLTLWSQRWDRQGNLKQFDRHWEDGRTTRSKRHAPEEKKGDRWQQLCRQDFEQKQRTHLTTNPLTHQDGLSFTLDDLYVPLSLVKRLGDPEQGMEEERTEVAVVSPQDFFAHLQQPTVNRVAIVGEPGAGKTTLLQQLAHWVLEHTDGLPVWISLADLESQPVEDYVIQTWLRQALGSYRVDATTIDEFVEQVAQGRVWLFLDAVDEMALPSGLVLTRLGKQMTGWLAQAKMVLTCRQNVWDGGKNALTQFETYECCEFSPSDPLEQFIQKWFHANPQLADQLWQTLNQKQLWRIKSLVTNPLRLALLCRIWSVTQGQLPTTKARLYGQFVEAIYVWKQDYFPTSLTQQYQLNQALGDLALKAMLTPEPLFRLPQSFVYQVFQTHDLRLLELALQLGWLKVMGSLATSDDTLATRDDTLRLASGNASRSPQTQAACIYGFYHGSFQEYFAAQALPSWQCFLDPSLVPVRSTITGETIAQPLIFKRQWREVFLLWLGRADVTDDDKCALLDALLTFEDGDGGFFAQRAYFLGARGLAEFPDYPQAQAIALQLVEWGFASGDVPVPIREGARRTLMRTDQGWAIAALEAFIAQSPNTFERWTAAYSLGKNYDPGNSKAIATLETIIDQIHNPHLKMNVARGLGIVDPGNPKAIDTLAQLLADPPVSSQTAAKAAEFSCKVALRLGQINVGNEAAIATLAHQLVTLDDEFQKKRTYQALAQIAPDHPQLQTELTTAVAPSPSPSRSSRSPKALPPPEQLMRATLKKLDGLAQERGQNTDHYWHRCLRLAIRLEGYSPGHKRAIAIYLDCLRHAQQKSLIKQTFSQLQQIDDAQIPQIFGVVRDLYRSGPIGWDNGKAPEAPPLPKREGGKGMESKGERGKSNGGKGEVERSRFCYRLLWEWADVLGYPLFCRLWQTNPLRAVDK